MYAFAQVNPDFIPISLTRTINPSRIPKITSLDFTKRKLSNHLRKNKLGEKLWWKLKHSWLVKKYYAINSIKAQNFNGINQPEKNCFYILKKIFFIFNNIYKEMI